MFSILVIAIAFPIINTRAKKVSRAVLPFPNCLPILEIIVGIRKQWLLMANCDLLALITQVRHIDVEELTTELSVSARLKFLADFGFDSVRIVRLGTFIKELQLDPPHRPYEVGLLCLQANGINSSIDRSFSAVEVVATSLSIDA
jgi:hypothetical protein